MVARDSVADIQRARMLAAMVEVCAERGAVNATIAHVVARSGVSRRTFYEQFADREECFLAAYDLAVERIAAVVVPAYRAPGKWRERVRSGLSALLEFFDREPALARLVVIDTFGAGHLALEHRRRGIAQIIALIDREGRQAGTGEGPPPLTAEGIVGAVLSIVHARLLDRPGRAEDESPPLVELTSALTSTVVLPYLGPAAARREFERPVPEASGNAVAASANPLRDLEMRLTYRTVRVLMAVGASPGVSNRRVADAAEVSDQGQISKLLGRLEHLGLVENSGFGQAKGESNSWYLTARGREIEGAIREQTGRG